MLRIISLNEKGLCLEHECAQDMAMSIWDSEIPRTQSSNVSSEESLHTFCAAVTSQEKVQLSSQTDSSTDFASQFNQHTHKICSSLKKLQKNSIMLIYFTIQHLLHTFMMIYRFLNIAFHSSAQHGAHLHTNLPGKLFSHHMLHVLTNCQCICAMTQWYASNPSNTYQSSIKLFTYLSPVSLKELENSPSHMRVHRGVS